MNKRTARPLLPHGPLDGEIQRFAAHLPREHQGDFDLARRPYQDHVGCAEFLRDQGQPGAEVGDAVGGVLWGEHRRLALEHDR